MDFSLPGSSVHGIFQARYWSGLPFPSPRALPDPGIEHRSPTLQVDTSPSEPPRKPSYHNAQFNVINSPPLADFFHGYLVFQCDGKWGMWLQLRLIFIPRDSFSAFLNTLLSSYWGVVLRKSPDFKMAFFFQFPEIIKLAYARLGIVSLFSPCLFHVHPKSFRHLIPGTLNHMHVCFLRVAIYFKPGPGRRAH